MRKLLAIMVCKLGRFVGKLIGKGSSMPGKFALKICPDILKRVQLPPHIIAVTGSATPTAPRPPVGQPDRPAAASIFSA